MEIDSPENMMRHIRFLKNEVERLKKSLRTTELQRKWPLLQDWSCRSFWLLLTKLEARLRARLVCSLLIHPSSTTLPFVEA